MNSEDKSDVMRILHNTPEFKPSEVIVAEEVIDSYLGDPYRSGYHILVAEIDSVVVGYVCFGPTPLTEGTWDVYWIAVNRERKGQGIGSILLDYAENNIRGSGGRLVIIETSSLPSYTSTQQFYIHRDYEIVARIPDFYTPGDDEIIFQKRLK
jgi:ribosomal protein S18 acetylase RimI-like enzyme